MARLAPDQQESSTTNRIGRHGALLMTVLCAAQALEVLGVTVVIVALPSIGTDLRLPDGQLQLVVSLYAVLYGSLLLTAGRVADLVDRRSVFAAGMAVTLAGAVWCALAPSGPALFAGRALQGLGGAIVTPAALSLLTSSFPSGRARRIALSAWTAAAAGGGAIGFALGGLVVQTMGWRGVFWLLAPVALVLLALTWLVVPRQPPAGGDRSLDLAGSAAVTAGLVLLVWGAGLVEDPAHAPLPPLVVLSGGVLLLVGFVVIERRGRNPLIRWGELTNRSFLVANGCAFVNTATTSASGTLVALVAARVLDLDPRTTGLVLLPFSIAVILGSASGSWWLRRRLEIGMAVGLATVAAALAALAVATLAGSTVGLAVAVGIAGLGLSWAAVTSTSAATAALDQRRQGVASGAVNTAAQVGTALGVAVLLTVSAGVGHTAGGYALAFVLAAALAGGYALLVTLAARQDPYAAGTGAEAEG